MASYPPSYFPHSSSQYDQKVKKECRSRLIEHAVRCLTTERDRSTCVQRDHVQRVWEQLNESGEAQNNFSTEERQEIEAEIKQWELLRDSQIQTRKPSDLSICYLGGDNPVNDLEVLVQNGVLCQNVWAIEKDSKTLQKALDSIKQSNLRNVRLFKGDILNFLKDFAGQFDIIYFDACGTLPAVKQNTLKVIGYVFLYNKLTSPGALITTFSFPPKRPTQPEDAANAQPEGGEERDRIRYLSGEYLKYRLCNTLRDDNSAAKNVEYLSGRTDEDIYSDYVTYQVIDLAYLFIPAQRMLLSKEKSLWDQIFVSRGNFFKEIKTYDMDEEPFLPPDSTENQSIESTEDKSFEEELTLLWTLKALCAGGAISSWLRSIATVFESAKQSNTLCKAWVNEIFPDWQKSPLQKEQLSLLLLTPLLFSSVVYFLRFAKKDLLNKCMEPFARSRVHERGTFPSHCDIASPENIPCLVAGLLYGQMAYPSFPVINKLLRLNYTAKERQMFSDVFIFDKCRYLYQQFPSADCASFAIAERKQQVVIKMVVDGLKKHLSSICYEDLFKFCNVARTNQVKPGVHLTDNRNFPKRRDVHALLFHTEANDLMRKGKYEEAVEVYHKCLVQFPKTAVICANIAHCYLKLNLPKHAIDAYNEALNLDPENGKAKYGKAMAFKMLKDYSKVLNVLKVLKIDKGN